MTTKRVFIASSAELKKEREELVDLMQDMNDELEKAESDIRLESVLWEYMDSSMRSGRKEDEYLEQLRKSEICIVLFWNTLGEYTLEELDLAVEEMRAGRCPKEVHVLFKEPADNASKELLAFKVAFDDKYNLQPIYFENIKQLRKKCFDMVYPLGIT